MIGQMLEVITQKMMEHRYEITDKYLIKVEKCYLRKVMKTKYRVSAVMENPGKFWNLGFQIPGLESHGILLKVLESFGISIKF